MQRLVLLCALLVPSCAKLLDPFGFASTIRIEMAEPGAAAPGSQTPPPGFDSLQTVPVRDKAGRLHHCRIPRKAVGGGAGAPGASAERLLGLSGAGAEGSGDAEGSGGGWAAAAAATEEQMTAPLQALRGQCLTAQKDAWWSFQVCHWQEVRQFHPVTPAEAVGLGVAVDSSGQLRHPEMDWSLGKFVSAALGRPVSGRSAQVHSFDGGQLCDETGGGRRARVQYTCAALPAISANGGALHVVSIEEPSVCQYELLVHVPELCALPEFSAAVAAPRTDQRPRRSFREVVASYDSSCFQRSEGWWTYELCPLSQIRQYHEEQSKVVQEYVLGRFGGWTADRVRLLPAKGDQPLSGAMDFSRGTACDHGNDKIDERNVGVSRVTEVRVQCANGQGDHIHSVREVATCRYVLIFKSDRLCALPAFNVSKSDAFTIQCTPA